MRKLLSLFLVVSAMMTLLNFSLQADKSKKSIGMSGVNVLTLDNYLSGASDEGNLQCLMRVLAKVNKDTKIDKEANTGNFQDDIREGVIQGIDVATM